MGLVMGRNLAGLGLSAADLEMLKIGLTDEALGKAKKVTLEEFGPKIQAFAQGRAGAVAAKEKVASEAFLTKAAAEKGAQKKPSGLIYTEVAAGTGREPRRRATPSRSTTPASSSTAPSSTAPSSADSRPSSRSAA